MCSGEEEESNVLQANVKLYLFDREKRNAALYNTVNAIYNLGYNYNVYFTIFFNAAVNRNWTERGRGLLRLNDAPNSSPGHLKSR